MINDNTIKNKILGRYATMTWHCTRYGDDGDNGAAAADNDGNDEVTCH